MTHRHLQHSHRHLLMLHGQDKCWNVHGIVCIWLHATSPPDGTHGPFPSCCVCGPEAFFNPEGGNCGNYNPAVPAASSVLSPMAAYFDGPASFFNSSGSGAMGSDGRQSQVGHDALPQAAPPTQEPHRASQTQRAPIMHAPMCMQPGMAAPFMLHPPQNMQSGVPVAPVSPGLQPPMCGMGPTLLQSRAPSQSQAKKKERDSEQKRSQGRAPCPIAVYVDLSSLRLRDKK